ncbi:MAG: tripartite tricarboxylate transporter substrate binding protein [Burkholderiales bacterium]|nr:tripartite tricarboxylate transporter substrate binding protein [Burkholderiales bacterium]
MFNRRKVLAGLAAAPLALAARAQAAFPSRPLRVIVGYTAGGAVDLIARAVAQQLQAGLGQPVVVENRPGAGTNVAIRALMESAADGHTLMLAANALAANVSLYDPAPYNLARDLTPVALVGRVPVVLAVAAGSQAATLQQFIAFARANPQKVSYGSPGNGSTPHLAMELFERAAGIKLIHAPYKGGSQAITDVLGGHIQAVAVNALEVQPHVRGGKLRVLAAMTPQRSPIFPEVPTVAESGFAGFEASVWYGLVAPAGLPPALVARLHAEVQKALASDEVRQRLGAAGGEVLPGPAAQFARLLLDESTRYARLIREAQIKPD